jgi:hypothetical protein
MFTVAILIIGSALFIAGVYIAFRKYMPVIGVIIAVLGALIVMYNAPSLFRM